MNWYRFRIELLAWLSTTALAVLTVVTAIGVFYEPPGLWSRSYPLYLRWLAEHEYLIPCLFAAMLMFLWVCRWRVLSIVRSDRRYGKR